MANSRASITFTDMENADPKPTATHKADRARARSKREALVIKDWRKGIGKLKDTPMAREADALGEQWRRAQRDR